MNFLDPAIENFAVDHSTSGSELLERIQQETFAEEKMPRMISGPLQGQFLRMISFMIRPKRILEIGTFTGYSALCMAEGLPPDGKLYTIDNNIFLERKIKNYFRESGFGNKIKWLPGEALSIIPAIHELFDLVFIDADKLNYKNYYDMVLPQLNKGGIIIADNLLWSGKVLEKVEEMDKDTRALYDFAKYIQQDNRVENLLLPLRDGLMIIRKV